MITKIRESVIFKPLCYVAACMFLIVTSSFTDSKKVTIKTGTPVTLQLNSSLSSANCSQGQNVDFRVIYDVKAEGKIAIPAGTVAKGQVVSCQPAKACGKPGIISIQIKNIIAQDGTMIYLNSSPSQYKGTDKQALAWAVGGALFFTTCIGGAVVLVIKGGEAEISSGVTFDAYVSTDTEVSIE